MRGNIKLIENIKMYIYNHIEKSADIFFIVFEYLTYVQKRHIDVQYLVFSTSF